MSIKQNIKNAGSKAYNGFMGLPPWARGITAVGTIAILYFTGRTIYRNARKKKEIAEANMAATYAQNELNDLHNSGINPTLSDSQFEAMSQALVQAMNGCGTDEEMVYSVFNMLNNDADIRKLLIIFGVRFYQPCAASQPISYMEYIWDDHAFGGGLPTWISYDMTAAEKNKINSILHSKNINYSF